MRRRLTTALILLALPFLAAAQTSIGGGVATIDHVVHDFGDVSVTDGPLSCSFTVTNTSDKDFNILSAISSCGCTDVKWTKQSIAPGKTGTISATYSNNEGAYPFDKTLTVYFSDVKKPLILHIRGVVHKKARPLSENYPVHYGPIAVRNPEIKAGNMAQGESKSGEFTVANIGSKAVTLSFKDISDGLSFKNTPLKIAAGQTASVQFTVASSRERWGKNWYYATPVADSKSYRSSGVPEGSESAPGAEALRCDPNRETAQGSPKIGIWAITKENFSSLSKEQKDAAALPRLEESTFSFPQTSAGKKFKATFTMKNTGKEALRIFKIDSESSKVTVPSAFPVIQPGKSAVLEFNVDTAGLPKGEQLFLLTVYTNSPLRPMLNLYINGIIL